MAVSPAHLLSRPYPSPLWRAAYRDLRSAGLVFGETLEHALSALERELTKSSALKLNGAMKLGSEQTRDVPT